MLHVIVHIVSTVQVSLKEKGNTFALDVDIT